MDCFINTSKVLKKTGFKVVVGQNLAVVFDNNYLAAQRNKP